MRFCKYYTRLAHMEASGQDFSPDAEDVDGGDGRTVHLVYSEYESAPSETDVEVIEGPQNYWWTSSKSPMDEIGYFYNHAPHGTNNYCSPPSGKEVCLVYSEYDEPSSETSVNMDRFFYDNKIQGREVRLVYSEYEEPPSETDVEYDGRPWCSIFGNPALWKVRDEGREVHLIYSDYTASESEAEVEIEDDEAEPEIIEHSELETAEKDLSTGKTWDADELFTAMEYGIETGKSISIESLISETGISDSILKSVTARDESFHTNEEFITEPLSVLSCDIYTKRPSELRVPYVMDSFLVIGKAPEVEVKDIRSNELRPVESEEIESAPEKAPVVVRDLENMDQLLAFTISDAEENTIWSESDQDNLDTAHLSMESMSTCISRKSSFDETVDSFDLDAPSSFESFESI